MRIHLIHQAYLALARGESFAVRNYTDAQARADIQAHIDGKDGAKAERMWYADQELEQAIYKLYGWGYGEQYRRGVIRTPSRLANKLICLELKKRFGQIEIWPDGILKTNGDVVFPIRVNGLIRHFEFRRLRDLQTVKAA